MEFKSNQLLSMFVEKLSLMEKVGLLFINHLHRRISNPINNANNIPICLCIIFHEPLESNRTQSFPLNNYIELLPEDTLNFHVLGLHVTNDNCHDLAIEWVINVTGHGRPSLNTFYVIEHHPQILKIVTWLH